MTIVYKLIENLAACYLILRALMEMVPNEEYKKYVRLFGSLLIVITLIEQLPAGFQKFNTGRWESGIQTELEKLNERALSVESMQKTADEELLSTYEEEVKTRINNIISESKYTVKDLKIGICEDVDSVDYGNISDMKVIISKNVDKTANISVNKIIVRQQEETTQNRDIKKKIAENLSLEEEVITVIDEE